MSATLASKPEQITEQPAPKSRRKLVVLLLVLVIAAAASWYFLLRPQSTEPKPGEVAALDAIQVNLDGGHYLRLGIALQLTADAHEVDGSKALDAAINVFSGLPVSEVNKPTIREALRGQLQTELDHRYEGEVMAVYFTEYVTQ